MIKNLLLFATFFMLTFTCFGQEKATFDNWSWLMGEWKGEGDGQPGQGEGTFSFSYDLDKNVIVRKSHSVYPATENKPEIIHDDLMVVYLDSGENSTKAIYFDNESHVINYDVTFSENSIVMTSEKTANAPVFRLTYTLLEDDVVNTKFEMSRDGVNFMRYVEGKSKRVE